MNQDKYVFAQLVEFLNNDKFRRLVDKYDGNRYVKHFTCWSQLLAMMFGQLSNRESLRDLIVALEAHQGKRYHLGLGREPIAKTTLASANQNRDYRIFEDSVIPILIGRCKRSFGNGLTTQSQMITLSLMCFQSYNQVTKTFTITELTEHHCK